MKDRVTQLLLAAVILLLAAQGLRPVPRTAAASGADESPAPTVLRAEEIQLIDKQGKVVAQLHVGEDGGGNLRLRSGEGLVRVKLGASADGSGLVLFDKRAEPAVWLASRNDSTSATLAQQGKEKRVLTP